MQKEDIKFEGSNVFEGMTSIRALIKANDLPFNDRTIKKIIYDKTKIKKIAKEIGYLKAVSSQYGYSVEEAEPSEIEKSTLGTSHGGIIAFTSTRNIPLLTNDTEINKNGFYCMIEGIEDPYNFGYCLRSLYACGCDGIILPKRNWMSAAGVVARSSAGASELFPIYNSEPLDAAKLFKALGYKIVCADENTDNILGTTPLECPIFLIIGGEKRGISRSLLDLADIRIKINYAREFRASLSAASATTMFAYEIMRQNTDKKGC